MVYNGKFFLLKYAIANAYNPTDSTPKRINCGTNIPPVKMALVSYNDVSVIYFKKVRLSAVFTSRERTKKPNGKPAPKSKEYLLLLKIQEEAKQILLIAN